MKVFNIYFVIDRCKHENKTKSVTEDGMNGNLNQWMWVREMER